MPTEPSGLPQDPSGLNLDPSGLHLDPFGLPLDSFLKQRITAKRTEPKAQRKGRETGSAGVFGPFWAQVRTD